MYLAASVFVIVVGLIIAFAPNGSHRVVALDFVAAVVVAAGALALAVSCWDWLRRRRRRTRSGTPCTDRADYPRESRIASRTRGR